MRFLITAGPTREPLDPVRYLSNRSSGRMGFALAEAAARREHEVILIAGPVHQPTPDGVTRVDVVTAQEMYEAVAKGAAGVDVAIHSAAVADYRPRETHPHKVKKRSSGEWHLVLERTIDILGSMREPLGFSGYLAGFAAETENLLVNAAAKLREKRCDLIVANDVSRPDIGFDRTENEVTLLFADGRRKVLTKQSKLALAHQIIASIETALSLSS